MNSEDMLCEVLTRLPAKSVLRFGAVSKTCFSFPSDNFFLKKHSEQALFMDDLGFFIQQDQCWGKVELHKFSSNHNDENINFDDYGIPNTSLNFLSSTTKIMGSYNGLLVLKNTNEEHMGLFICNPATQKCFSIPKSTTNISHNYSTLGIHVVFNTGAAEFPDDYGLIMVKPTEDWSRDSDFYMYTKGQAWEEMGKFDIGARNLLYDTPVYCNGLLHFISDTFPYLTKTSPYYKPYIVACDIEKATTRHLKLPKEATSRAHDPSCEMRIFKWKKPSQASLCLIRLRKSVFMAWVLEDYEMGSWIPLLKTRVRAMGLEEPDPIVCGFTVMNGDSLVFATKVGIYCYKLVITGGRPRHSVEAEKICGHGLGGNARYLCLTGYANTLRPCGSEERPLNLTAMEPREEEENGVSTYSFIDSSPSGV